MIFLVFSWWCCRCFSIFDSLLRVSFFSNYSIVVSIPCSLFSTWILLLLLLLLACLHFLGHIRNECVHIVPKWIGANPVEKSVFERNSVETVVCIFPFCTNSIEFIQFDFNRCSRVRKFLFILVFKKQSVSSSHNPVMAQNYFECILVFVYLIFTVRMEFWVLTVDTFSLYVFRNRFQYFLFIFVFL